MTRLLLLLVSAGLSPTGGWIDYWSGEGYGDASGKKPVTVNGYPTPLETLPLFVRAGAIIPMWCVLHA